MKLFSAGSRSVTNVALYAAHIAVADTKLLDPVRF